MDQRWRCDDSGIGAEYSACLLGTDCGDCGGRQGITTTIRATSAATSTAEPRAYGTAVSPDCSSNSTSVGTALDSTELLITLCQCGHHRRIGDFV